MTSDGLVTKNEKQHSKEKMSRFESGAERAFGEIIGGVVTSAVLISFVESGILSPILFILLGIAGIVGLMSIMPYWSTTYLLGWLFGLLLFLQAGLIGSFELIILIGIPLVILIKRLTK
ncbi:MAG: hypothetical protein ACE5HH_01540 [Candidatus Hydrothermarchaeales archaeon]